MLQPVVNAQGHLNEFSWLAVLLGYPILGIWYWCADQTHVQRVLGARSLQDGQNGALFAGFLKITPVFLMVLPGVIGYVLWQKGAYRPARTSPGTSTRTTTRCCRCSSTISCRSGCAGCWRRAWRPRS